MTDINFQQWTLPAQKKVYKYKKILNKFQLLITTVRPPMAWELREVLIRLERMRKTVRLILHSSRAVTVGAIKAPRYGGCHVTGFVGVD